MSKLPIAKAAALAGVERTTLYRKREKGELSFEKDGKGNMVVDLSELRRVYPDVDKKFLEQETQQAQQLQAQQMQRDASTNSTDSTTATVSATDVNDDVAVLKERVEGLEKIVSIYERDIEYLRQQNERFLLALPSPPKTSQSSSERKIDESTSSVPEQNPPQPPIESKEEDSATPAPETETPASEARVWPNLTDILLGIIAVVMLVLLMEYVRRAL